MKYFFLILGFFIIADICYFSYVNQGHPLILNYNPFIDQLKANSGFVYLFLGIYGAIGGLLISFSKVIELQREIKKLYRKSEKSSIESEESSDKVKALESKIMTLEAALKEALKKK
jgi:hypothetical protein